MLNEPFLNIVAAVCGIFLLLGGACAQEADIDQFIERIMGCLDVPGLSLTVIRGEQDYMVKGYGVRDLTNQEPVTNQTLTLINSNTKAFAAATAATLVKNNTKNLDWYTPIRDVIGDWFYMNDSLRTSHVNMRDLLGHRVGMAGYTGYMLAGYTEENEDEAMRNLQYLPFLHDFRDRFHYNNLMYQLAGYVIKSVDGRRWEDVAKEKILTPLGMDDTTFIWDETRWGDMMTGHKINRVAGSLQEVSQEVPKVLMAGSHTAGGGMVSNALDIRHWLRFQLSEGTAPSGEEILSPTEFQTTHTPTNHFEQPPRFTRPEYPVNYGGGSYSMGWFELSYRDYQMSQHSGGGSGYGSLITLVPSMDIAIFSGINTASSYIANDYIHMYILDVLLGYEPWLGNLSCSELPLGAQNTQQAFDFDFEFTQQIFPEDYALNQSPENVEFENLVGVYGHYALGNATVYLNGSELLVEGGVPGWIWHLFHLGNSTFFSTVGNEPLWYGTAPTSFELDEEGVAQSLTLYNNQIPSVFHRDLDWANPPPPPSAC